MNNAYDALHQYIREDLAAAGQKSNTSIIDVLENFAHLAEGPVDPNEVRSTRGKLNSDGSAGPVTNTNPWNILKLNFSEMAKLAAGTVKDVGILLIDGGDFNVTKAGIALAGLINRFQNAATRKLNAADGKVIFAIARVDKNQSRKSDIKSAYRELFSEELRDEHLEESIKVLNRYGILIDTGASIRLKERLEIEL